MGAATALLLSLAIPQVTDPNRALHMRGVEVSVLATVTILSAESATSTGPGHLERRRHRRSDGRIEVEFY